MYAGHFAAGLAIKAAVPRAPTGALMGLVFLPDLLWLVLSVGGVESVTRTAWFDGWSHSFASIIVQAVLVAVVWWRRDSRVVLALAGAVLSHLILDLPMHPAALEWYPHAGSGFGNLLHGWSGVALGLGKSRGWWLETATVLCGAGIYAASADRVGIRGAAAAAGAVLVVSLQIAFG